MHQMTQLGERQTTVDLIADPLYEEVATLRLMPGTGISETAIAERFGVSVSRSATPSTGSRT